MGTQNRAGAKGGSKKIKTGQKGVAKQGASLTPDTAVAVSSTRAAFSSRRISASSLIIGVLSVEDLGTVRSTVMGASPKSSASATEEATDPFSDKAGGEVGAVFAADGQFFMVGSSPTTL